MKGRKWLSAVSLPILVGAACNTFAFTFDSDGKFTGNSVATFGTGEVSLGLNVESLVQPLKSSDFSFDCSKWLTEEHRARLNEGRSLGVFLTYKSSDLYPESTYDLFPAYFSAQSKAETSHFGASGTAFNNKVEMLGYHRVYRTVGAEEILQALDERFGERAYSDDFGSGEMFLIAYTDSKSPDLEMLVDNIMIGSEVGGKRFLENSKSIMENLSKIDEPIMFVSLMSNMENTHNVLRILAIRSPSLLIDSYAELARVCNDNRVRMYEAELAKKRAEIGDEL